MGRFRLWFGRSYRLLSVAFVLAILAVAAADELSSALKAVLAWSSQNLLLQLLALLAIPLFFFGLIRIVSELVLEPLKPALERDLKPFLLPIVDWLNRSEEAREEIAQVEYRWPPKRGRAL